MRIVNLKDGKLNLKDDKIEGFLERIVTPIGTSAKVDVQIGRASCRERV